MSHPALLHAEALEVGLSEGPAHVLDCREYPPIWLEKHLTKDPDVRAQTQVASRSRWVPCRKTPLQAYT